MLTKRLSATIVAWRGTEMAVCPGLGPQRGKVSHDLVRR